MKRRPVPREWRESNHRIRIRSRIAGGGWGGWDRHYRAGGTCSCGQSFGLDADNHTMDRADVLDEWLDHVEDAYYAEADAAAKAAS